MLGSIGVRAMRPVPASINRGAQQIRKIVTENVQAGPSGSDFWGKVPNWAPPIVASTGIGVVAYGFNKQDLEIQGIKTEVQGVRTEVQGVRNRLDVLADRQSETSQAVAVMSAKLDMLIDNKIGKK